MLKGMFSFSSTVSNKTLEVNALFFTFNLFIFIKPMLIKMMMFVFSQNVSRPERNILLE